MGLHTIFRAQVNLFKGLKSILVNSYDKLRLANCSLETIVFDRNSEPRSLRFCMKAFVIEAWYEWSNVYSTPLDRANIFLQQTLYMQSSRHYFAHSNSRVQSWGFDNILKRAFGTFDSESCVSQRKMDSSPFFGNMRGLSG